jgi:RNA polymerase sigma-70 factor (ECF subfamily)
MQDELSSAAVHHTSEDVALMLRYQAGDAGAFDTLYAKHRLPLFRFIARQRLSQTESEEVFQEVWMNVIDSRWRYTPTAEFRTWLFTLAHHRLMDFFRRTHRKGQLVSDDENALELVPASRTDEPSVQTESRQQGNAILQALAQLPAPQREAFLLHEEGGMTIEEIAAATGQTYEAAKSRLRYAIARLRERLKEFA